jgi:hypothetical protein
MQTCRGDGQSATELLPRESRDAPFDRLAATRAQERRLELSRLYRAQRRTTESRLQRGGHRGSDALRMPMEQVLPEAREAEEERGAQLSHRGEELVRSGGPGDQARPPARDGREPYDPAIGSVRHG